MKRTASLLVLALAALSLHAFDPVSAGFEKIGESLEDGLLFDVLKDQGGTEFLMRADHEPSAASLQQLRAIFGALRSWKSISVGQIRVLAEADRLRLIASVKSLRKGTEDFAANLVSGLQVFVSQGREYDFRVKSGNYFIRLRGILGTEQELLDEIVQASKDPAAYLAMRDPQYAVRRTLELDTRIEAAEALLAVLKAEAARVEREAAAALEARAAGLEAGAAELGARILAGEEATKALDARLASLESSLAALETSFAELSVLVRESNERRASLLETAVMASLQKGLFSPARPVRPEVTAKLVELKAAEPALDQKTAALRLKEAGVAATANEIKIVFGVRFGEW